VARRQLRQAFAVTSFYLHRDLRDAGRPAHAAESLRVAAAIRSDSAAVWYNLACALAQADEPRQAVAAFERAVEAGFADHDHVAGDPDLDPIRDRKAFKKAVARMGD
jgi:hypothetical protein